MRIVTLCLFALLPLAAGCVDPDCKDDVVYFDPNHTYHANGEVTLYDPCYESSQGPNNTTVNDYSMCCPPGYEYDTFNGSAVVCSQDCSLNSASTASATADAAFVAHAVADAALAAVEELHLGPPQ